MDAADIRNLELRLQALEHARNTIDRDIAALYDVVSSARATTPHLYLEHAGEVYRAQMPPGVLPTSKKAKE